MAQLYNHSTPTLSELDQEMIGHVSQGGNWRDIPSGLSSRVDQIRERSNQRGHIHTTYYGRLRWDMPAYTISTYFTRSGNGAFIHPEQDRLISAREAARLQSFPDHFVFGGSRRAVAKQIGNAVPPLLGAVVGSVIPGDRVVDLFAGAGGLSYGLERAGKSILLAVEADMHAAASFRRNHSTETKVVDTELDFGAAIDSLCDEVNALHGCDILVGGPPCQSFSTAGLRQKDSRSELLLVFIEALRRLKPPTVLIENVPGLKSFDRGQALARLLDELRALGYRSEVWDLYAEQYGVPQRRHRVFVVGTKSRILEKPLPVLPRARKGRPAAYTTVRDAIGDLPPTQPGDNASPIEVDLPESASEYQLWLRNKINTDEFLSRIAERARNHQPQTEFLL